MSSSAGASKPKKHAVVWDEKNLDENEKIKAELAPVKITEPKTPYHAPLSHEDAELGLEPLALDELDTGHVIHSHSHQDPASTVNGQAPEGAGTAADGHIQFECVRKQHYNMKEVLQKARHQADKDLKDEEDSMDTGH